MKHVNKLWLIQLMLISIFTTHANGIVNFTVSGLEGEDKAVVSISSYEYLITSTVTNGEGSFSNVPAGKHALKIEANGYNIPASTIVVVDELGNISPTITTELTVTKMSNNENEWTHSWASDGSTSGYSTTAYINTPPQIDFLGKKIIPADVPSMSILLETYKIILSDEGEAWTQEYAYRLLETLKTIPCNIGEEFSKFTLTSEALANDINVTELTGGKEVVISKDAFYYANPFLVNLDGVRGRFFSKRLHHAMVNYLTDFGNDSDKANEILSNRFGCKIKDIDYTELTAGITDEDASNFQEFNSSELVSIINMFEEMPEGFHKIPELKYLIRRKNGYKHPLYPEAAAVAWPIENGYIEFMEKAFGGSNEGFETLRLILHEKSHFLWAFSFSEEIKNEWIELGGWYQDPNNPDGWATSETTEFVSEYAHAHNPDEDMAESVAHYLKNPELLQSRSLPKYEFIRDRIMHGTRYISSIPEHLTFEVLNLYPDYDYPGKIKKIDISVTGAQSEDKLVRVQIELNDIEGYNDDARTAFTRIESPGFKDSQGNDKNPQYIDLYLNPIDETRHILAGEFTLSKYCKSGYWRTGGITVYDDQLNTRYEGNNDFVWNMYIDNALEDIDAPIYEDGSLNYKVTNIEIDGHLAQNLEVSFKASDNIGVDRFAARLLSTESQYSYKDSWGIYDKETGICTINYTITEFYPTANYYITSLSIYDIAGNETYLEFNKNPTGEQKTVKYIYIETTNPDSKVPELDLNRISVYAEPTNPEAPDGETFVTINYYAKDDKSGLGNVYFNLKDPQGIMHGDYHYHRNFYTSYFDGDPTVWEKYTIIYTLPKGSAPGIWGVADITLDDKALNGKTYNFVETLIFEPDDSTTDYVLFSELDNNNILTIGLTSDQTDSYGFTYRIIHEDTGKEISGTYTPSVTLNSLQTISNDANTVSVDVSSLDDGKLVIITLVKDKEYNTLAVRSTTLTKDTLSGINTLISNNNIQVITGNEMLIINNPGNKGDNIYVFSINGQLIKQVKAGYEKTTIPLQQGIYIVKIDNKSFKVVI